MMDDQIASPREKLKLIDALNACVNNDTDRDEVIWTLDDLPPDVLARIIQHLSTADIHNLETTSKGLHSACQEERVWYSVCTRWPTAVRQWLPPFPVDPPQTAIKPPQSFRELYHMLKEIEDLRGVWRVIGEGPSSALVTFNWTPGSMVGYKLEYTELEAAPEKHPYAAFSPSQGLSTSIEWNDENNVTLKDHGPMLRRSPSYQATEDIAAVAYGGTPTTSVSVLGSSPEGSFEHEWLRFMSSNVALGRSKVKRRSSKGMGGGVAGLGGSQQHAVLPTLHHIRRVVAPKPTARHPLAGLWVANYGEPGLQILKIFYDFSGRAARIVAEKVTGDVDIPAGGVSWTAHAAAVAVPWPEQDAAMVEDWQQALWEEGAAADELDGVLLDDIEGDDENGSTVTSDSTSNDGTSTSIGLQQEQHRGKHLEGQVVSVHSGRGQAEGGNWVEGRLWVHGDGTLSFHWLESHTMARIRRIDNDVPPPP